MATNRNLVFANNCIYHLFNRGIDRRPVFTGLYEYKRAQELIKYYQVEEPPVSYSKFLQQPEQLRQQIVEQMRRDKKSVNILSYCLMPNHFHFMLQQNTEKGIANFISNFTNAYTRYFNTKHERKGPMFEGVFKAVLVESDEQLIHLSRYIHLNPVVSSLVSIERIKDYPWSSYASYLTESNGYIHTNLILSIMESSAKYEKFVLDYVEYVKKLHVVKHLLME